MNIGQFYSKEFLRQSGELSFLVNFDSVSKDFTLGISGSDIARFIFDSGKIFDTNYKLISSYPDVFTFKGIYSKSKNNLSYFINDRLIGCVKTGSIFNTGSYFDSFFITNNGVNFDANITIGGNKPNIVMNDITQYNTVVYNGSIFIDDQYAQIYSINGFNNQLKGYGSGQVVDSGYLYEYYVSGNNLVNNDYPTFTLKTNFGDYVTSGRVIIDTDSDTGYLNFFGDNKILTTANFISFGAQYYWTKQHPLSIGLYHIESNSEVLVYGTGIGTGIYDGFISGSGFLSSNYLVGYINSGKTLATGYGSGLFFTTGQLIYEPFVTVTGLESGILSTGIIQFSLTGNVLPVDYGTYYFNTTLSGTPSVASNYLGTITSPTGVYYGTVNTGVTLNKYMSVLSSGDMVNASGYDQDFSTNIQNFLLRTGDESFNDYQDFSDNGWLDGSGYYKSDNVSGYYNIYGRIYYTPITQNSYDIALLRISNGIDIVEYEIKAT